MIVLASSSPRRVELLKYLGLAFDVIPSNADESFDINWGPEKVVLELSLIKAIEVAARLPTDGANRLVLGGDTIVVLDDEVINKPGSKEDACQMLSRLSGRKHTVYTGVAVLQHPHGNVRQGFERSDVYFRHLQPQEIRAYVDTGEPMDKAGAYALQGVGSAIVEKIEGCYTNIIGFPIPLVVRLLRESGVSVLGLP